MSAGCSTLPLLLGVYFFVWSAGVEWGLGWQLVLAAVGLFLIAGWMYPSGWRARGGLWALVLILAFGDMALDALAPNDGVRTVTGMLLHRALSEDHMSRHDVEVMSGTVLPATARDMRTFDDGMWWWLGDGVTYVRFETNAADAETFFSRFDGTRQPGSRVGWAVDPPSVPMAWWDVEPTADFRQSTRTPLVKAFVRTHEQNATVYLAVLAT